MQNSLELEQLELHMFTGHDNAILEFKAGTNEFYGKNASGKTSIANAYTYAVANCDFFGNRLSPFRNEASTSWVNIIGYLDGNYLDAKRLAEKSHTGSVSTNWYSSLEEIDIDKDLFLTITNPRYFINLQPAAAKELILKVMPTQLIELEEERSKPIMDETGLEDEATTSEAYDALIALEKANSSEIKNLEKLKEQSKGAIKSLESSIEFFKENGRALSDEQIDLINVQINIEQNKIEAYDKDVAAKNVTKKRLARLKSIIVNDICKLFNKALKKASISLESDGKEVFAPSYDGKSLKTCSYSEQMAAGLDIINAINGIMDLSYPTFIDNSEALQNISLKDYPNIEQTVILSVSDCDLSKYNGEELEDIKTKECLPRTREALTPDTKIVMGTW